MDDHGSAYDGLADSDAQDDSQWAFGTSFEDPLAGMDTTVPDGVDPVALAALCLALGDDALVMSHRLSQWCSNAPDLEDDIALANIALDLLGQARLLLARAADADPALVPRLPAGSPAPVEDALAFFREAHEFTNVGLVELENGDFAHTVVRLLLVACVRLVVLGRLADHPDPVLAAIAGKGATEVAYHRDYAARWFVTLAQGTEESRRRLAAGLDAIWPWYDDLLAAHPAAGDVRTEVDGVLDQVLTAAGMDRPRIAPRVGGRHTEALGRMLAEMQVVARAHPLGQW